MDKYEKEGWVKYRPPERGQRPEGFSYKTHEAAMISQYDSQFVIGDNFAWCPSYTYYYRCKEKMMAAIDWTKPIVIAATDWQEELPARVLAGPSSTGNYRVLVEKPHRTRRESLLHKNDEYWFFETSGKYYCGSNDHIRVINKATEEKITEPKFVFGQTYLDRSGHEYVFIADLREIGMTMDKYPLLFKLITGPGKGLICSRGPDGKSTNKNYDILLPRKSVSFLGEGESTFVSLGKGCLSLSAARKSTYQPTWPVAEMKRQGDEMVFVKMHYPEDAE